MCEIQIRTVDSYHEDPDCNECHCWKNNDIVQAMPDGTPWGTRETGEHPDSKTRIILAVGLDSSIVNGFCGPKLDSSDPPQVLLKSRCYYDEGNHRIVNKDDPNDYLQL